MKTFLKHIRLFFHPKKGLYFALYQILGFFPDDLAYYEEALRHKSYFNNERRNRRTMHDNERLEFLGDAVLNAIVGDILFKKFPSKNEGFLTNTRSKIVKRETMDRIGNELGLSSLMASTERIRHPKCHIYGNALEAFIGAIYLDKGYRKARCFIEEKIIRPHFDIDTEAKKEVNFKSKLLEWAQRRHVQLAYEVSEHWAPFEHALQFKSVALLNGIQAGEGEGFSKKESQQYASKMALHKVRSDRAFAKKIISTELSGE
ncbi:ribonuclease 3 [Bacteroidia bacterium]|nr:ribonuclease 3 [Bacteroidia bacterium]